MRTHLAHILDRVPIDDPIARRQAPLLLLTLGFLFATSGLRLAFFFETDRASIGMLPTVIIDSITLACPIIALLLLLRGTFFAATVLTALELLLTIVIATVATGLRHSGMLPLVFALPIVFTGLLIDWRGLVVISVTSCAIVIGLAILESQHSALVGFAPSPEQPSSMASIFVFVILLLCGLLSRFRIEYQRELAQHLQTETVLRRSEAHFASIFRANPAAMSITRMHDGSFIDVNTAYERMFGYRREELIGQNTNTIQLYAAPTQRGEIVQHLRKHGSLYNHELTLRTKSGSLLEMLVSLECIEVDDETCILTSAFDLTERKQAEARLAQQTETLARSNAELEQFAYVASHDLQEPLRAVAGMVQLLQKRYQGQLDARADQYIVHAVEGANRMQALINDLLTFSRVGHQIRPFAPTNLTDVLQMALSNLTVTICEHSVVVTHTELPIVHADERQLVQLLQNLIGNAIKFRSDKPPTIQISAERQEGAWCIRIQDNGIGIEPQYFERIFVVFQRLHNRRAYPGTGIGLALCKKIVEHHGGRIWVDSTPGQGTTFSFTLPDRSTANAI